MMYYETSFPVRYYETDQMGIGASLELHPVFRVCPGT